MCAEAQTRATMQRYFNRAAGDTSMLAEDVVFTVMWSGEEHRGRHGVEAMLRHFYREAFDGDFTPRVTLYGEHNAMIEGEFTGRHIAGYAGVPATGREVRVPLCVVYDVDGEVIRRGRVYFEVPVFLRQVQA